MSESKRSRRPPEPEGNAPHPGPVMIIGGAEDKLHSKVILTRFVLLSGGADGHIVVVSTASSLGDLATEVYRQLFTEMGASRISGLRPTTREEANEDPAVELLAEATGIFLTGGNQLKLLTVVGGTKLGTAILQAHDRGAVVAGTSAGASALSTHMMAFGSTGESPKHRMAQLSAGLGLLRGVVVDQHFEQRGRIGRLLAVVAQSPSLLGLGLDEDTAAVVEEDQTLEVIGRGAVTIVDGSNMSTDAFQTKGHRPMMVTGATLHSLPSGYRFDLRTRELLPMAPALTETVARKMERADRRLKRLAREMAIEGADSLLLERRRRREQGQREASE